jgi:hypothetical protein
MAYAAKQPGLARVVVLRIRMPGLKFIEVAIPELKLIGAPGEDKGAVRDAVMAANEPLASANTVVCNGLEIPDEKPQ